MCCLTTAVHLISSMQVWSTGLHLRTDVHYVYFCTRQLEVACNDHYFWLFLEFWLGKLMLDTPFLALGHSWAPGLKASLKQCYTECVRSVGMFRY